MGENRAYRTAGNKYASAKSAHLVGQKPSKANIAHDAAQVAQDQKEILRMARDRGVELGVILYGHCCEVPIACLKNSFVTLQVATERLIGLHPVHRSMRTFDALTPNPTKNRDPNPKPQAHMLTMEPIDMPPSILLVRYMLNSYGVYLTR